ncbi:organomercurial lyase [Streptomyces sp. NBC_01500]|uniref:organomercurial lyase n=1 Tax=Streptomyces sp. NBC_01500 TaxID=2903886 RepID=UPI00224E26F7|nr:organomercurial lyase [Streptomyces sp. NBC_01500]MCX4550278.1 alkylmercury lyase family protein [Streptomyces sp. NBC_01500]
MRITVLTVPDCPNGPVVQARITTALGGRDAEMELVEVSEQAEAERAGMTGSPTVLLDGVDPFGSAGATPSVSCRIYRHAGGEVDGAPSVDELRTVLTAAGLAATGLTSTDLTSAGLPDPADGDCCAGDALDLVGRGGRGRLAPVEGGLRAVHQAVLRHFAATGSAPELAVLEPVAAAVGRRAADVLAELAREDFLTVDRDGQIRAAYPFSAVPTPHRVVVDGGVRLWSMCAIDALGIPAMLGQDVVITSADPATGETVTVTCEGGRTVWEPSSAVVFVGRRGSLPAPAADVCCDTLNFFADRTASAWAGQHPDVNGTVVDQASAERIGRTTFGPLLTDS